MPIKKVPYYRVHVRGAASNCEPEDTMQVYEAVPGYQGETNYLEIAPSIPCGAGMLISRFLPGSYRLILAINKRPRATRGMASAPFTVTDRNVEVIASLAPGIAVGGRFIAEDGARPPDFSALGIWLDPIGMLRFADLATPTRPGSDGKFHLEGVPAVDHRAVISGTGAGHYVKEIRFNGGPLRDGVVPLEQAALAHSLTIVIDDKPATLTGAVIAGDKAVSQPYLVLARWPLASGRVFVPAATTTGDSQGKFQFAGLAPGEYRVVSLRSMVEDRERAPGTLERALAVANKIELGPSAFQNITVEVSDLRK